jgi:hypothetical protein
MVGSLIGLAGVLAGLLAAWLFNRSANAVLSERLAERDRQVQQADADLRLCRAQLEALSAENTTLKTRAAELTATLEHERKSAAEILSAAQQSAAARQADIERTAVERLASREKSAAEALAAFQKAASEKFGALEAAAGERLAASEKAGADQLAAMQQAAEQRLAVSERNAQEMLALSQDAASEKLRALEKASVERLAASEKASADQLAVMQQAAEERLATAEKSAQEKLSLLEEARRKLSDAFQALSAEALKSNNQAFLQLARETLEKRHIEARGELQDRQQAIEQLVKPIANSLSKVDQQIQELEKSRVSAYAVLSDQVRSMGVVHGKLQAETANLVTALRAPQGRGRWGEIQLQRVVELAGMIERCDFDQQPSVDTVDGKLRPDLVVHLPLGKSVVVDAKVPLIEPRIIQ